jgi:hypothetical protein
MDSLPKLIDVLITVKAATEHYEPLAIAVGMLTLHGVCILLIGKIFHSCIRLIYGGGNRVLSILTYMIATGLILCTHFLDILIWTYTVIGLKVFDNDLHAFYYIGAYYTTVGTTSFVVPQNWQILPIFISFTGIFSASLSAAVLYSMINTLMQNEASKRA